jgi:hypothetical protein
MSGNTAGAMIAASTSGLRTWRAIPTASKVPSTVAMIVAPTATKSVFISPSRISLLSARAEYHFVEKPPHEVGRPLLLNDSATRTTIGTNKNPYTNARWTRSSRLIA